MRLNTSSGDVAVGYCSGSVAAHTTSGDIDLGGVAAGRVELATRPATSEWPSCLGWRYLDLASTSGDVRSDLVPGDDQGDEADATVEIRCRSLSGDIRIRKAKPGQKPAGDVAITARKGAQGEANVSAPRSE